jgi:hypothetical protein
LGSNNPTVLELLNTPEECILYKHPVFDMILNDRDNFLSKKCANSFGGYARQQIGKAKGQNKKQNWEKDKVTRKDVLVGRGVKLNKSKFEKNVKGLKNNTEKQTVIENKIEYFM